MATYQEQLDSVQSAISAIESGAQSYSISGRSMSKADLGVLYDREERLLKKVARSSRGGIRVRGVTPVS